MSNKKKYKNGIAKLGRQLYEVLVTRRDRRSGQRVSRRRTVHGSRHEAEAVKRRLEEELDGRLSGRGDDSLTLTDYAPQWLEARSCALKPSTLEKYVNDLGKHILPALGHMKVSELRPRDITGFLARDLGAPNSKKNRLALLRVMAKDALADELTDRDFCLRVSVKVPAVYTELEPNLLDAEQFKRLIAEIPQQWLDLACMLSFTGLRWGEVSAFHWRDVDLQEGMATVRWNNWKGELVAPKTARSWRVIPLVDDLVELLLQRHERMIAERHPGLRRGLVFPTETGGLHKGTPLNKVLRQACERAGIEMRFTPHGLRRTWNDVARRVADGLVVRSMIGHASEAMTDHYSMVDRGEKRTTASAVVEQLTGGRGGEADETEVTAEVTPVAEVTEAPQGAAEPGESRVGDDLHPSAEDGSEPSLVDKMVDAGAGTPASKGPKSE